MHPAGRVFGLTDNVALYEVLGVGKSASDSDIKRAFRRLAVQFHPDKNPDGVERFQEISFAYKILSDAEQRSLYDSSRLKGSDAAPSRAMNPDIELAGDELRDFVDSLAREEQDATRRRETFEQRKREEAQRRARYERENPCFKMPSLPSVPDSPPYGRSTSRLTQRNSAVARSPLEELEALSTSHQRSSYFSKFEKTQQTVHTAKAHPPRMPAMPEDVESKPSVPPPSCTTTAASYCIYTKTTAASGRRATSSPPTQPPAPPPPAYSSKISPPMHSRRTRFAHSYAHAPASFLSNGGRPDGSKPYEHDVSTLHTRTKPFDYKLYVQDHQHADLLHDAILSDALKDFKGRTV